MNFISKFITREKIYFKKLHGAGQKLLLSIFLYNLIGPILGLFINAFLWRQSHDITLVAMYNLCLYVAIPLGFYLNGLLQRKIAPHNLYSLGLFLDGITVSTLIFLPQINVPIIIAFGLISGIAVGIFWGSRNLLTLKTTQSDNRIYFSSLESSSQTLADLTVPILLGFFITFGATIHWYLPLQAYQIIAVVMLSIIFCISLVMKNFTLTIKPFTAIMLKSPTKSWNTFRWFRFIRGFQNGALGFIPTLIVLSLVGAEETLGTIQALSAGIAALLAYLLGKSLGIKHRLLLLQISFGLGIFGAGMFSLSYSVLGVLIFFACLALTTPFIWMASSSLNYDLIEKENKTEENHYAHVFDQEVFLNLGRITGVAVFIAIIFFFSTTTALRFTPLLLAGAQIFLLFIAQSLESSKR